MLICPKIGDKGFPLSCLLPDPTRKETMVSFPGFHADNIANQVSSKAHKRDIARKYMKKNIIFKIRQMFLISMLK